MEITRVGPSGGRRVRTAAASSPTRCCNGVVLRRLVEWTCRSRQIRALSGRLGLVRSIWRKSALERRFCSVCCYKLLRVGEQADSDSDLDDNKSRTVLSCGSCFGVQQPLTVKVQCHGTHQCVGTFPSLISAHSTKLCEVNASTLISVHLPAFGVSTTERYHGRCLPALAQVVSQVTT